MVWGIILNYFPAHANISSGWVWLFYIAGYVCFMIGVVGAIVELGKLPKNEFLSSVGIACIFVAGSVALHFLSGILHINGTSLLILHILVLIFAMVGVLELFMSLQYLDSSEEKRRVLSETFTVKNIVGLIVGILGFVTVLIQLVQVLLPSIHH